MGDAAGYATVGFIAKFRDEFEHFIEHKRSKCDGVLDVEPNQAAEVAHA
jgi:NADH-quinone oxidoreductase subunit F